MNVNIETSERRAAGHTPFSKSAADNSIEFATADDIRASFKPGAPQLAKNASLQFQRAFNAIYDQPRHEPYREKVAEMVQEIAKVNAAGIERAEVIFKGLNNSGVAKAIAAHDAGAKNPALSEMVVFHRKLSDSFEPLKAYVKSRDYNPANSNRVIQPLAAKLDPEKIKRNQDRLATAGFA